MTTRLATQAEPASSSSLPQARLPRAGEGKATPRANSTKSTKSAKSAKSEEFIIEAQFDGD
jgi:hypothetical protein